MASKKKNPRGRSNIYWIDEWMGTANTATGNVNKATDYDVYVLSYLYSSLWNKYIAKVLTNDWLPMITYTSTMFK